MQENAKAWQCWALVADQWRVGMEVVGFDLPGASQFLDSLGLADPDLLLRIRVISQAALTAIRERRKEK